MIKIYIFSIHFEWLFSLWNVLKTKNCELKWYVDLETFHINLEWLYTLWNLIWTRNSELKYIDSKLVQSSCSGFLLRNRVQDSCSEFLFRILVQDSCSEFLFRILVQDSCTGFLFRLFVQVKLSQVQYLYDRNLHFFYLFWMVIFSLKHG